jgi:hypothetical protein
MAVLSSILRTWFANLTGGRPMQPVELAFKDVTTGKEVFYHLDLFGRLWMARSPWCLVRIRVPLGTRREAHG